MWEARGTLLTSEFSSQFCCKPQLPRQKEGREEWGREGRSEGGREEGDEREGWREGREGRKG